MRRILAAVLCLGIAASANGAQTAPAAPAVDREVAKGIHQVDEGEYDTAILTLDAAARRLAAASPASKDLGQAYLYLGIAYLAKGQEISARARFRDAVKQARDLNLSPEKFAPRVIEEFERAREEERKSPSAKAVAPSEKSDGGSTKWILAAGGVAVVGAAGVLVLGGGGEAFDPNDYQQREGILNTAVTSQSLPIGPGGAGRWHAELSWNEPSADVTMVVFESTGTTAATGRLVRTNYQEAEFDSAGGGTYTYLIGLRNNAPATTFTLDVAFPKP